MSVRLVLNLIRATGSLSKSCRLGCLFHQVFARQVIAAPLQDLAMVSAVL